MSLETQDGLLLVRADPVQQIVCTRGGRRRVLFEVNYDSPQDGQPISPLIYDWLDTHRVDQRYCIDGVHLNPRGHAIVAETLATELLRSFGSDPSVWRKPAR